MNNKTACIILNWKKPEQTVTCLNSVLSSSTIPNVIFVVDNHSEDDSILKILREISTTTDNKTKSYIKNNIVWIETIKNIGYAGGINTALKEIINTKEYKYTWILNNDSTVSKDTFSTLLKEAQMKPHSGFIGSPIFLGDSDKLQCYGGGKLYPHLGISALLYRGKKLSEINIPIRQPDYIMGCNLLVNNYVINDIGYMNEDYFMYSEEVEWQYLAKKSGWSISTCLNGGIHHGEANPTKQQTHTYCYYRNRGAILFVRNNFNYFLAVFSAILHIPFLLYKSTSLSNFYFSALGLKDGIIGITGKKEGL